MFRLITKKVYLGSSRNKETLRFIRNISSFEEISYKDPRFFPSEDGIIQNSVYGDKILVPKCTLDQYVWLNLDKFRHKTAIECGITGKSYSYEKLRDHSAAFAVNLIKKLNVKKGDTVAVCLPNAPEFPIAALGGIEAGAVISTYNPAYTSEEISKQMINSDTKVIIGTCDIYDKLLKAVQMSKRDIKIVLVKMESGESLPGNAIDFSEMSDPTGISFDILDSHRCTDLDATVMLPYSSGTTGVPKGVELTHRNLVTNAEMLGQPLGPETLVLETTDTHQDVLPCFLPFFHIYGWTCTLTTKLKLGCKIVTLPSFKPNTFINVLSTQNATILHLVPPIVNFLVNSDNVTRDHLKSVRIVMSGAAPLGKSEVDRFMEKAPQARFSQGYGLTESSPVALVQAIGSTNFGSVGSPPAVTQAKIVDLNDPDMVGLGPDQKGEILIRGPHIMKGYYKNEAATKETFTKNGWLRTGDIGYYDKNHQFYVTDRLKELIKVKGFQVAPAELETILKCHPDIADAAVIGVPHKSSGEVPRAYIVAKPNAKINEKEIMAFVQEKVTPYKRLESVVVIDEIPKNATGKIMRREIKAKYVR